MTVCPPKGSNTALYHDLVKAGNGNLAEKDKKTLREAAYDIFIKESHKEYANKMLAISNERNLPEVLQGLHSLPEPFNGNGFKIKMWNVNGTITSPWFEGDFLENYYKEDKEIHVVLEFPDNIKDRIGDGSFEIELEVYTREETGWIEAVIMKNYSLHTIGKNWFEAETECQKDGGSLASVTSEEENIAVSREASTNWVWIGGRRELWEWNWVDNSTWDYTKWGEDQPEGFDDSCAHIGELGSWFVAPCTSKQLSFVCEKVKVLKGGETFSLSYSRDEMTFPSFQLWYNYKAASPQLLDSWKDKRMTGFRLSWKIEKPTMIWTTSISEVGRSIQTPGLVHKEMSSGYLYKATLLLPKDFQQISTDRSFVVELDVDLGQSDECFAFTSYKLYRQKKTRIDAEAHCQSEGGQLASIHSQWEQTLAEKAAEEEYVFLGGRKINANWTWPDNANWNFTHWAFGRPSSKSEEYLLMHPNGQWADDGGVYANYFLCQGKTAPFSKTGSALIELKQEQLTFSPFHILFKGQGISHRMTPTSSEEETRFSGFTLNWFLKDSNSTKLTKKLPASQDDWKQEAEIPNYKQSLLDQAVVIAKFSRTKKNMTRKQILDKVIQEKVNFASFLEEPGICSFDQVQPELINEFFAHLLSRADNSTLERAATTNEDLGFGFELYHSIVFCPTKLYFYVDRLLSYETSRTIIHSYVNLFHSKVIKDKATIRLMNKFYDVLSATMGLEYGNILMATSTKSQLRAVFDNEWPFLANNTELVKNCLEFSQCDFIQNVIQGMC